MTPEERARELCNGENGILDPGAFDVQIRLAEALRSARLEALEEAAKIAETLQAKTFEIPGGGLYARMPTAEDIAAAIRERAKA